jgi:pimeloyl-ACP methyl ester carboxylesterase
MPTFTNPARHRQMALAVFACALATAPLAQAQDRVAAPTRQGHVLANGVRYYYEIHGQGEPLLVLHGGLGTIDMFGLVLPEFTAERQVIAVELHGHGRTGLGSRDISYIDLGNDMAVILKELGFTQVDAMGYSFGGGVALRLAIQHPTMVRRLVVASAGYARDGFYPEMLPMQAAVGAAAAEEMKESPMYQGYVKIAPDPAEFPRLLDQMGALLREPFDWSDDVKQLPMPVMLVYGDSDMFRPEHIISFYQLLGGGLKDAGWMREHMSKNRLAILPDVTHYELFAAPQLAATVLPFLNGKSGAEQVDSRQ